MSKGNVLAGGDMEGMSMDEWPWFWAGWRENDCSLEKEIPRFSCLFIASREKDNAMRDDDSCWRLVI
jgi:hypothetical protein